MWRSCLSIISIVAYVGASIVPAVAADPLAGSGYDPFDIHHRRVGITPGAYIRIPFSGSVRRSVADSRLGLALAARLPGHYGYRGRLGVLDTPKFIDLSIGLAGRDSLRLNGLAFADIDRLNAEGDGKTKKKKPHLLLRVAGDVALVFIGVGIVAIAVGTGNGGKRRTANGCKVKAGKSCEGN